jgi:hypothetical protein
MIKKYEFTGEIKKVKGVTLRRLRRLSDGLLGGWVEKEENLSHEGNCFVFGNAQVYGDACVCGNARVSEDAQVAGNAWVSGTARVSGDARVAGNAQVYGNAQVAGNAQVYGNAWVSGNAQVAGNAQVSIGNLTKRHHVQHGTGFFEYPHTVTRGGHVRIGCQYHTLEHWETHGEQIAKEHAVTIPEGAIELLRLLVARANQD